MNVDLNGNAVLSPWRGRNRISQPRPATLAAVLALGGIVLFSSPTLGQNSNMENGAAPSAFSLPAVGTARLPPSITGNSAQNPFLGSTPQKAVPGVLNLSLQDALQRGLRYNLGLLLSNQGQRQAEGARLAALSRLLPDITTRTSYTAQQVDLATFGIPPIPGVPPIVGPFEVFDARGFVSQRILDFNSLNSLRAQSDATKAARYSYQDARNTVVLVVGGSYMQAVASAARIETVRAQLQTASALYQQSLDMKNAGLAAAIDVLRSQVEMQAQQQRLLAVQNDFEKQKLGLARTIGLPAEQAFTLADTMPFTPAPPLTLQQAIDEAFRSRADYRSAESLLHAAEMAKKAANDERLPSLSFNGDYGDIGNRPTASHGTFTAAAALKIPIFQGGKVHADQLQADARLQQRRSQLEDMRGRIEYEVRAAFLDLKTAADQVNVAGSSVDLATQQLGQARDRFAAGVTDTIEVVQAQEALAAANDNYISALFAHNLAKLSLARALGVAEQASRKFLGGK
ncbi:MAG TPA: TolC family protein [Terriglobales bacterium]|nr:TolC family protein [Terriglobales bacterium]